MKAENIREVHPYDKESTGKFKRNIRQIKVIKVGQTRTAGTFKTYDWTKVPSSPLTASTDIT